MSALQTPVSTAAQPSQPGSALVRPAGSAAPQLHTDPSRTETAATSTAPGVVDALTGAFGHYTGSPALQQMSHLGLYLQDCDDESRQAEMIQCLQALPQQTLMHAAQNLKKRAFWLNAEETCEFERANELKVLSSIVDSTSAPMRPPDQAAAATPPS